MASISLKGNKLDIIFKDGTRYSTGIAVTPENVSAQVKKAIDAAQTEYILDDSKIKEVDALYKNMQVEVNKITAQLRKPAAVEKKAAAQKPAAAAGPTPAEAKAAPAAEKPRADATAAPKPSARVAIDDRYEIILVIDSTRFRSGVVVDPKKPGQIPLLVGRAISKVRDNPDARDVGGQRLDGSKRGALERMASDPGALDAAVKYLNETIATKKEAARNVAEATKSGQPPTILANLQAQAPRDTTPQYEVPGQRAQPQAAARPLADTLPTRQATPLPAPTPVITIPWLENQFRLGAVDSIYINKAAVDGTLRMNANNQKAATAMVFNSLMNAKKPEEVEAPLATYLALRAGMDPALAALQDFISKNGSLTANAPPEMIRTADALTRDFLLRTAAGRDPAYHAEVEQVDGANSRLRNVDNLKANTKDQTRRALLEQQFAGPMDAATMSAAGLYLRRVKNPNAAQWKAPAAQERQAQAAQQAQPQQPAPRPPQKAAEPKREIVW